MSEQGRAALAIRLGLTFAEYDVYKGRATLALCADIKKGYTYCSIGEDIDRYVEASKLLEVRRQDD